MAVTQTVIKIEAQLWKQFKAGCLLHDTHPTTVLTGYVQEQVQYWKQLAVGGLLDTPLRVPVSTED